MILKSENSPYVNREKRGKKGIIGSDSYVRMDHHGEEFALVAGAKMTNVLVQFSRQPWYHDRSTQNSWNRKNKNFQTREYESRAVVILYSRTGERQNGDVVFGVIDRIRITRVSRMCFVMRDLDNVAVGPTQRPDQHREICVDFVPAEKKKKIWLHAYLRAGLPRNER